MRKAMVVVGGVDVWARERAILTVEVDVQRI